MIEDELRRRQVRDVEQTSARPVPKQVDIRVWIVIAIILGLLAWVMFR